MKTNILLTVLYAGLMVGCTAKQRKELRNVDMTSNYRIILLSGEKVAGQWIGREVEYRNDCCIFVSTNNGATVTISGSFVVEKLEAAK